MKAKVKATGEIVNVWFCTFKIDDWEYLGYQPADPTRCGYISIEEGKYYEKDELEFLKEDPKINKFPFASIRPMAEEARKPDWEQRRYELAKAAMHGYMSNVSIEDIDDKSMAKISIRQADEMIKQLKER